MRIGLFVSRRLTVGDSYKAVCVQLTLEGGKLGLTEPTVHVVLEARAKKTLKLTMATFPFQSEPCRSP